MLEIQVADEQQHPIDAERLAEGARRVLSANGITDGEVSIAVVDDARMHELNRQYLCHDYPTDVLSFLLEHEGDRLEGEVIVSADYAAREAKSFGWSLEDELLLYVVHGCLHLVGHDDQTPAAKAAMRLEEQRFLKTFGLEPRYDERP